MLKYTSGNYIIGIKRNKLMVKNMVKGKTVYTNTKHKFCSGAIVSAEATDKMVILFSRYKATILKYSGGVFTYDAAPNVMMLDNDSPGCVKVRIISDGSLRDISEDMFTEVTINRNDIICV